MSAAYMPADLIPDCCRQCRHVDWGDDLDRGYDTAWCRRALIFPTKKQSCSLWNKPLKHQVERSKPNE